MYYLGTLRTYDGNDLPTRVPRRQSCQGSSSNCSKEVCNTSDDALGSSDSDVRTCEHGLLFVMPIQRGKRNNHQKGERECGRASRGRLAAVLRELSVMYGVDKDFASTNIETTCMILITIGMIHFKMQSRFGWLDLSRLTLLIHIIS